MRFGGYQPVIVLCREVPRHATCGSRQNPSDYQVQKRGTPSWAPAGAGSPPS